MRRHLSALLVLFPLASIGCDDTRPAGFDGGPPRDGAAPGVDAGTAPDGAAPRPDAGTMRDAGGGGADAGPGDADVALTFSGCSPDFSGDVVVVRNSDSIAVSSTAGGALGGSVQLALQDQRGLVTLSTRHRVDTGAVINVIVGTTWTNIARDSGAVLGGTAPDPIGGTLNVREYDEAAGRVDVEFTAVTLQNPSDGTVCRVDGRLRTFGLSF